MFETPCITSTPVRTAITNTCSFLPAISYTFTSDFPSRSTETTAPLISETINHCRNGINPELVSRENSSQPPKNEDDQSSETIETLCQPVMTYTDNIYANTAEIIRNKNGKQNSGFNVICKESIRMETIDEFKLFNTEQMYDINIMNNKDEVKSSKINEDVKMTNVAIDIMDRQVEIQLSGKCTESQVKPITGKDEVKILVSPFPTTSEKEDNLAVNQLNNVTNKMERSVDHTSWQQIRDCESHSVKRIRRKKNHSRRSFSEADRLDDSPLLNTVPVGTSSCNNPIEKSRKTVNEDKNCPNDDHTSLNIVEVPDVAVIDGGFFISKDLCSNRVQTSRVLTAPSRATYTTAFI